MISIRIMLSHLIGEPWTDILQDEAVLLKDRLCIIFRFLEDDKVCVWALRIVCHFLTCL